MILDIKHVSSCFMTSQYNTGLEWKLIIIYSLHICILIRLRILKSVFPTSTKFVIYAWESFLRETNEKPTRNHNFYGNFYWFVTWNLAKPRETNFFFNKIVPLDLKKKIGFARFREVSRDKSMKIAIKVMVSRWFQVGFTWDFCENTIFYKINVSLISWFEV